MIPDYLQSLVKMPEKFWPEQKYGARSTDGKQVYGRTAEEAMSKLTEEEVKQIAVLERGLFIT